MACALASSMALSQSTACQQHFHQPHNLLMNLLRRLRGVNNLDAVRIGTGESEEAFTDAAVELLGFEIETGLGCALAALVVDEVGAAVNQFGVEVEQNGEVGNEALCGEQGEPLDQRGVKATSVALVGDTGVEAAVGDNELASLQRGQEKRGEVLGTVGLKEKGFRQRRHAVFGMVEQQFAYLDAEGRTARLARAHVWHVTRGQPLFEQFQLRRLARAIQALKGDQASSARMLLSIRAHERLPLSVR